MGIELLTNLQINLLFDLAVIIVFATAIAFFARLLKQPLIVGYIIAGIILGPQLLGLIKNSDIVLALSEIGIAFLLFFVGLEMNLKKLKEVGFIASLGTIIQVILTFIAGFFVALLFGFSEPVSAIIGFIVAFSSTSIVVKILSDKEEINTLHGRITLGILLMQDIIIIFLLSTLSTIQNFTAVALSSAFFKGIILLAVTFIFATKLFPKVFDYAAKYQELLLLLSLTIFFFFSAFAAYLGFSIAVGTFMAGVAIASLPYNIDILGMIKPLKDFFVTIFFVSLGMQLQFTQSLLNIALITGALLFVVIIIKPLIIMAITSAFGYERRTSFLTSISLGQISEFSLILAALALYQGLITKEIFSLTIVLLAISMIFTAYILSLENWLYFKFSKCLAIFEKLSFSKKLHRATKVKKKDIVLFGCDEMGSIFLNNFRKKKKKVLVVDYNPATIKKLKKEKIHCLYGDMLNEEVLKAAELNNTGVIVSTIKDVQDNSYLIEYTKRMKSKAKVIVIAERLHQAVDLYELGADYVIVPKIVSGEKVAALITDLLKGKKRLESLRKEHIKHIMLVEKFKYIATERV